jgi:hypothetical protein
LINDPSVEHRWYRMIEISKKYFSQKQIQDITDLIYKIAQDLMSQKFSIEDLQKIKLL